jgi:hypothetical protein
MRWLAVLVALAVVGATASQALAAACPKTTVADLEDEVMCLVCGVPLALPTRPRPPASARSSRSGRAL